LRNKNVIAWALAVLLAPALPCQVSVLTQHNNNARTGANLEETQLTVAGVNNKDFGKLVYRTVDGNIYAQPLIVAQAKTGNGATKNLAIVATENNSVYAFDADDVNQASTTAQLWRTNLGPSLDSYALYAAIGKPFCTDITLQIGITSTPAIMITGNQTPRTGVVFVTAKTKNGNNYTYSLVSLDLTTGTVLASVPMQGQVPGKGYGSKNGTLTFNPLYQLNRPGLLLAGNTLYIAFGGHCDSDPVHGPYHGWVFAYDVSNPKSPKRIAVMATTPNGTGPLFNGQPVEGMGGIWMSGEGPSVDGQGNLYLATGNGSFDGKTEFSDSVLKIKLDAGKLGIQDWFTPANQTLLKNYDYDLGSGGVALIPNTHLALAGGKEGRLFLLDQNNLGKGAVASLQSFQVTHPLPNPPLAYNIHGAPVIWPRNGEMYVYIAGEEDPIKQYRLIPDPSPTGAGWKFESGDPPFRTSKEMAAYPNPPNGLWVPNRTDPVWMPGGFLALSANGTTDGTGILWVATPYAANANPAVVRGVLRAFDASDVSKGELWDSEATGMDSDRLGQFAKFCPPTVANGKVYMATFQQETITASGQHIKTPNGDQPSLVIYGPRKLVQTP
jgi:hypothetical protein